MTSALSQAWSQPLYPFNSVAGSALAAAVPLAVVLLLMGVFRRSGLVASACGLVTTAALALLVWGMPPVQAAASVAYGCVYALWPVLWIVFTGLWLYKLACEAGSFELLRRWMAEHASGDSCIQALLVAFCFGALLESCAGFGAPVAVTAFLLVGLGFEPRRAVVVALLANTAPVGFGSMGIPVVALGDVTGLDRLQLSAMVGRQLPFLSLLVPFVLVWVVGGRAGLKRAWPPALAAGGSYACSQFLVSNFWGPYAADIVAATISIGSLVLFLRFWTPRSSTARDDTSAPGAELGTRSSRHSPSGLSRGQSLAAWVPWVTLTLVVGVWSYLKLFQKAQITLLVPALHNAILLTLYQKPYAALYYFRPLEVGTAIALATVLTGMWFRVRPHSLLRCGAEALRQLSKPALTVMCILGLAYLYNYSGMAYTLGAAVAHVGSPFPLVSSYLGWVACFLSGSDTASNVLFGNLQVAAAHQLNLNPVLLAATNSSGGVISKMISPQNIAVGVTTVGLVGEEGRILRRTFWPSILLAAALGLLAYAQAYWMPWMVPGK